MRPEDLMDAIGRLNPSLVGEVPEMEQTKNRFLATRHTGRKPEAARAEPEEEPVRQIVSRRPHRLPWLAAAAVLVIALGLGAWKLLSRGGPSPATPSETESVPTALQSGKYCLINGNGHTYPEQSALKFDFENGLFDFGLESDYSSLRRIGKLRIDGDRITARTRTAKYEDETDRTVITGYVSWQFERMADGSLQFLPADSDPLIAHGMPLGAGSVLVRVGELDEPINTAQPIVTITLDETGSTD